MSEFCPLCGASWRKSDFGTDGNGRLVYNHVCKRQYIDAGSLPRYENTRSSVKPCCDCGRPFTGTATSIRCRLCKQRIERKRHLWKARDRQCSDCGRHATKASPRCRRCQRSHRIRQSIAARKAS